MGMLLPLAAHHEILSFAPWSAQITAVACASTTMREYSIAYKDQASLPTQFLLSILQPGGESYLGQFVFSFQSCSLPAFCPVEYPVDIVALRVECPCFRVCRKVALHVWYELLTTLSHCRLRILSLTVPSMSLIAFWNLLEVVQDVGKQLNLDSVDISITNGLYHCNGFGIPLRPDRQRLLVCIDNLLRLIRNVRITVMGSTLSKTDVDGELLGMNHTF
jgi:hypothetical protein